MRADLYERRVAISDGRITAPMRSMKVQRNSFESANEELVTLNEELQTRNMELDQTNMELTETRDYAQAIIKTVREPLVILDSNLRDS